MCIYYWFGINFDRCKYLGVEGGDFRMPPPPPGNIDRVFFLWNLDIYTKLNLFVFFQYCDFHRYITLNRQLGHINPDLHTFLASAVLPVKAGHFSSAPQDVSSSPNIQRKCFFVLFSFTRKMLIHYGHSVYETIFIGRQI